METVYIIGIALSTFMALLGIVSSIIRWASNRIMTRLESIDEKIDGTKSYFYEKFNCIDGRLVRIETILEK